MQVRSGPATTGGAGSGGGGAGDGGEEPVSDVITLESLHPHATHVNYGGVVYLKGASALRIVIDPRTEVRYNLEHAHSGW